MVGARPQVNKFEQVQAVVTWIPLLPDEQKDRQTDTSENITFPNYVTGGRYDTTWRNSLAVNNMIHDSRISLLRHVVKEIPRIESRRFYLWFLFFYHLKVASSDDLHD